MSLSERDLADAALKFWPDPAATSEIDRAHWTDWLAQIAPEDTRHPPADCHKDFWDWLYTIELGTPPDPSAAVLLWPRGIGKSKVSEIGVANLGARQKRRYCLYVCATQDDADKHVANIAVLLESTEMAAHYPEMGSRLLNKFGQSKGWKRNRLRTSTGFTCDAIGLGTDSIRGLRTENQRPDLIVFDDVDKLNDQSREVRKIEGNITRTVLPAGSGDVAVVFAQNLIHAGSVANRLHMRESDWLADRWVSGPFAAVDGLEYESAGMDDQGRILWKITAGEPMWEGMDLAECERRMNKSGPDAFIAESQNDVTTRKGALWSQTVLNERRVDPGFERGYAGGIVRAVVGVDPSGSDSPTADECGIVVAGKGADGRGYVLADRSIMGAPHEQARRAIAAAHEYAADIVVETNFGAGWVVDTIRQMDRTVRVVPVNARVGKVLRAQPVAALYAEGFVSHVGRFPELERQLTGWLPEDGESPDRLDACVYALAGLFPATGVVTQSAMADGRARR